MKIYFDPADPADAERRIYEAFRLLVSPSLRQSAELFRKVSDYLDSLQDPPEAEGRQPTLLYARE